MKSILSHKEYYHIFSTCAVIFFIIWLGLFGISMSGIEVPPMIRRSLYITAELMFVFGAILHYSSMGKERRIELEKEYLTEKPKDKNPFEN